MKELKTKLHQVKVRCTDCNHGVGKQLELRGQNEIIDQALIDLMIYRALFHEQRHPTHNTEVIIYENAPETEPSNIS